jgi:hypothetical protein
VDPRTPARDAIGSFLRHLAGLQLSDTTRRIRGHFMYEYLSHAEQGLGTVKVTLGQLMDPARAHAWLNDAASGKTRIRNTLRGPTAAAYPNSMRVRTDSWNAFAEYLRLPDRLDTVRPFNGDLLTPAQADRLLYDLAMRRPIYANATTALRTAAVAALVAETGRTVPELAGLKTTALHLKDADPSIDLDDGPHQLGPRTVQVLTRWLDARAAIIAELEGSDPGHLWIPTKPGRPRGGLAPVKPGLTPAAVRTLHAAHRTLVSQVLGTPLRPGALRASSQSRAEHGPEAHAGQTTDT